uniref:Uncharacterized protein n=1 Tax=Cyprinus carpio TaxID=7962 RepID=A0A8C2FC47_CYPCA
MIIIIIMIRIIIILYVLVMWFSWQCLWCQTNSSCTDYPVSYVIPPASVCELSQARWGVCWGEFSLMNRTTHMLTSNGTSVLLSDILKCICSFDSDDEQFARRREEIRQRADERYVNLSAHYFSHYLSLFYTARSLLLKTVC